MMVGMYRIIERIYKYKIVPILYVQEYLTCRVMCSVFINYYFYFSEDSSPISRLLGDEFCFHTTL